MKERPILFSAPMVRAILDCTKTQTRRVITCGNSFRDGSRATKERWAALNFDDIVCFVDDGPSAAGNPGPYLHVPDRDRDAVHRIYPQWQPGDQLWVRENHAFLDVVKSATSQFPLGNNDYGPDVWDLEVEFSDGTTHDKSVEGDKPKQTRERGEIGWRPSIHMPRWASRIQLEIVSVRIERLQEISEADAQAEGCSLECMTPTGDDGGSAIYGPGGYMALWESINGLGSWDENPWVWVISFHRLRP